MTIADELRRRIARGDLVPGDPLPSENDLATDLGYSKPTVREALRILENEGLIEVKLGLRGGPHVRQLSISEVAKPIGVYLQIGDVAVSDVWAARDRIVGAAIERLAGSPNTDLELLEEEIDALTSHIGDLSSFYINLISTAETAVQLAGSATDHLVVVALRHVMEVELAAATAAVDEANLANAVEHERDNAEAWRRVLRNIRGGRPRAARGAYEAQAFVIRNHIDNMTVGMTVADAVNASPADLINAHAAVMGQRALSAPAPPRPPKARSPRPKTTTPTPKPKA